MGAGKDLSRFVDCKQQENFGKITGLYVKLNSAYEDTTFMSRFTGIVVSNKNSTKNNNSLALLLGFGCGEEVAIPAGGIQLTLLDRYMHNNRELFIIHVGHFDLTVTLEQLDILSHYYNCKNFTVRHGQNITVNTK